MKNTTATNNQAAPAKCLCGASTPDSWTAGVHHNTNRCARVITRLK